MQKSAGKIAGTWQRDRQQGGRDYGNKKASERNERTFFSNCGRAKKTDQTRHHTSFGSDFACAGAASPSFCIGRLTSAISCDTIHRSAISNALHVGFYDRRMGRNLPTCARAGDLAMIGRDLPSRRPALWVLPERAEVLVRCSRFLGLSPTRRRVMSSLLTSTVTS